MRCPNCDFVNRPDARFCKRCGQSLEAQVTPPTTPTPAGFVCLACGATAKPGRRFCPRCGKPLQAPPVQPSVPPPSLVQEPAQPPGYATPLQQPPPPVPPPPGQRLPKWVWGVGGVVILLCIATLVIAGIAFGPELLHGKKAPTAPVEPTLTESVEEVPAPAQTPTAIPSEMPTEAPTGAPAMPPTETSAEAMGEMPSQPTLDAHISLPSDTLQVGGLLTITVTVTNTRGITLSNLRYELVGDLAPFELPPEKKAVENEVTVLPGEINEATFELRAAQEGLAALQVHITTGVHTDLPTREFGLSEMYTVSVTQ
jgi:hypothetical protein